MGGGRGFKAQPKEPKQQQGADGVRRQVDKRRALKILEKRCLTGQDILTNMKSDREAALLQKPGVQGQGGSFMV